MRFLPSCNSPFYYNVSKPHPSVCGYYLPQSLQIKSAEGVKRKLYLYKFRYVIIKKKIAIRNSKSTKDLNKE